MTRTNESAGQSSRLQRELTILPESRQIAWLFDLVCRQVATVTGRSSGEVEATAPWRQLGIYREQAARLREWLSTSTGLELPATVFFDHTTPAALVEHLRTELMGGQTPTDQPAAEGGDLHELPIAIVGMACRYPGGIRSPEQLWQLVAEEADAISPFPENRGWWADGIYDPERGKPGKTCAREGGFLHDADQFDADFFGISPREAAALDPQQRILLEISWEALERAGIDPASLKGSRTGVFVGIAYQDYGPNWHQPPDGFTGHLLLGSLTSAASGRIAYTFGFEGPAVTVDTACSSSLVSLHLACQALRTGECSLALAGGATVMATPGVFLEFSCKRGLAPDGRCKSFSADADGTGWGEGAGVLLLERLAQARRAGHRVLGLVRGTAINQDGASNGLSAPNGPAQVKVIRQALANAGLSPPDVDAVEAHGTGTTLGDPIEAQALLATYGRGRRPDDPLWLGSLKSNVGHTQAAAAVGGIIKMVMAMKHGLLPRTLHVSAPTPHVHWSAGGVSLLTQARPWPRRDRPRRAGVSAFGVSGTNGHAILEEAPECALVGEVASDGEETSRRVDQREPWTPRLLPFVVQGKNPAALPAQARRLLDHWRAHPQLDPADVGRALSRRARFKHRAVVLAEDREGALRGLEALARGAEAPGLIRGRVQARGKLAFLLTGQGSQRPGMGRALAEQFPPFRRAFAAACEQLDVHLDRPLGDLVLARGGAEGELLDETVYAQAALFAFEVALFRLIEAWGVRPDYLIGHSIGELVAAHLAGVLSLEDACKVVAARGRLMQAARSGGAMVALEAGEDEVLATLAGSPERLAVAAVNAPASTVIAGDEAAVAQVADWWRGRGRKVSRLRVSHAFHSPHMDGVLGELRRLLESVTFAAPAIPIVSNGTGELATAEQLAAPEYWVQHVRRAVRFRDGMRCLEALGVTAFLELGPDAVLTALGQSCLSDAGAERSLFVPSTRAGRPEADTFLTALAELHVRGVDVSWEAAFTGRPVQPVDLPTYAFQYQRYWLEASGLTPADDAPAPAWEYRVVWRPAAEAIRTLSGTWLVVAQAAGRQRAVLDWLTSGLAERGGRVRVLAVDDCADRGVMRSLLENALGDGTRLGGILSLLALDDEANPDRPTMTRGFTQSVALVQAWAAQNVAVPLWCATRGAVSVAQSDPLTHPAQAMVWGLGRTMALEHPDRWGGLVDLPDVLHDRALRDLCAALAGREGEDQIALRRDRAYARRLVQVPRSGPAGAAWKPRGTVLITGGTGALGLQVARWLARNGAEHLVLVSRRGGSAPAARQAAAELGELGVRVTVEAADVADRDSVERVLASLPGGLTAVVHAAGASGRFASLSEVQADELAGVVSGKVGGALHLDALLQDTPLEAFVMLSSIAGVWGSGGQAAYAAANAFLDGLAEQRRARGQAATAVAFGPWAEEGMAADPAIRAHLGRCGLVPMAPGSAVRALGQAVAGGSATLTVADVDWGQFLSTFTARRPSRLFDELPGAATGSPAAASPQATAAWTACLVGASSAERERLLLELVRTHAAAILGHASPEAVDPDGRFLEIGFDSLAALELRQRLARATRLPLTTTAVFDHATATALARHLSVQLGGDRQAPPSDASCGGLKVLYRYACDRGLVDEAIDLLKAAAKLRPVFARPSQLVRSFDPVPLARGTARTSLICFPPFVCPSGPHNYARIALRLDGLRDVLSFAHPGFGDGEPVPESADLVIEMHADAVMRTVGARPFVLAGYSSGGWFAHAVADRLEAQGVRPSGVVLLDSLSLKGERWEKVRAPLRNMVINEQAFALTTDDQLTAMAAYFRAFDGWKPRPIQTPIMVVRARECIPEWMGEKLTDDFWRGSWDLPHSILEVPGDHFTLVNQDAGTTALALHQWLATLETS